MKEFALNNLMKMAESSPNGLKTPWGKEKLMETKGEIACYAQFLLFEQYFQKTY